MVKELFEKIRDEYVAASKTVFTNHPLAKLLRKSSEFKKTGVIDYSKYKVRGSAGQTTWSFVPWIAVFDKDISTTAQKGFYIVYLFSYDMKKVYLSLNQGWTYLHKTYGTKKARKYIAQVVRRFQSILHSNLSDFTFDPINLEYYGKGSTNPEGYEKGHICGKCYDLYNLPSNEELAKDLQNLLAVFRELKGNMVNGNSIEDTYNHILSMGIIESSDDLLISPDTETGSKGEAHKNKKNLSARTSLERIIMEEGKASKLEISDDLPDIAVKLDLSSTGSGDASGNDSKASKSKKRKKTNYDEKNEMNELIGKAGELMVFRYECDVLRGLEITKEIEWVAQYDDSAGYDIKSYDKDKKEKHIEVKTTLKGLNEPFYLSANEAKYSIEHPDKFYLYRIYDFDPEKKTGKLLILKGNIFDYFEFETCIFVSKGRKSEKVTAQ